MNCDTVVIGGGVIGLACAGRLSRLRRWVVLLEKESRCGTGISSRNSEVIHAGIYYPPGSKKAFHCLHGKELLYEWCKKAKIPHTRTGKLIVATSENEERELYQLSENATKCGVNDLAFQTRKQIVKQEPLLSVKSALLSPSSGIFSVHALMDSLEHSFTQQGGHIVLRTKLKNAVPTAHGFELEIINPDGSESRILSRVVINAAGLFAGEVAEMAGFPVDSLEYRQVYCKGNYFRVAQSKGLFRHLVYPVPEKAGLGIHITLDLDNHIRLGPDVEWLPTRDEKYAVDENRGEGFMRSVSRYWPGVREQQIFPDFSGIRPKRIRDGFRDFVVAEESENCFPGWFNLIGIESPGLTAALSIAEEVSTHAVYR